MSALIAYKNLADSATLTTPGSATPSLENLKTRQLTDVVSVVPAGGGFGQSQVDADLGAVMRIDIVGLLALNREDFQSGPLRSIAMLQVKISNTSDHASPVFSGNGQTVVDFGDRTLPMNVFCFPGGVSGRYVRIEFYEPLPGYQPRRVGRVWIGPAVVFERGTDADWAIDIVDPGALDVSAGGQWFGSPRPKVRKLSFNVTGIKTDQAVGTIDAVEDDPTYPCVLLAAQAVGTTGEVIVIPRASIDRWVTRTGIYGHFHGNGLNLRHLAGPNFSTSGSVIEER